MQNNKQQDDVLVQFRNQHGKVARFTIAGTTIYARGLRFGEWINVVRETKFNIDKDGKVREEISDRGMSAYILPCVLKPEQLPREILSKPMYVSLITTTILNITDFDKADILFEKYKKALARQTLLAVEMKRRLIETYGIQIVSYLKSANIDDIIELIAMGEYIRQDIGSFAATLGKERFIPMTSRGKINAKKLLEMLNSWLYEAEDGETEPVAIPPVPPPVPKQIINKPTPTEGFSGKDITITDIENMSSTDDENKKTTPDKLSEPKFYDSNPETMNNVILERNKREFGGNLVNIWNESMATLYEKIQDDIVSPSKIKSFGDLQKEDDKSNIVLTKEE